MSPPSSRVAGASFRQDSGQQVQRGVPSHWRDRGRDATLPVRQCQVHQYWRLRLELAVHMARHSGLWEKAETQRYFSCAVCWRVFRQGDVFWGGLGWTFYEFMLICDAVSTNHVYSCITLLLHGVFLHRRLTNNLVSVFIAWFADNQICFLWGLCDALCGYDLLCIGTFCLFNNSSLFVCWITHHFPFAWFILC